MKQLKDFKTPKETCKFCRDSLNGDILGYNNIGFCSISCFILDIDLRVKKLEAKIK